MRVPKLHLSQPFTGLTGESLCGRVVPSAFIAKFLEDATCKDCIKLTTRGHR